MWFNIVTKTDFKGKNESILHVSLCLEQNGTYYGKYNAL